MAALDFQKRHISGIPKPLVLYSGVSDTADTTTRLSSEMATVLYKQWWPTTSDAMQLSRSDGDASTTHVLPSLSIFSIAQDKPVIAECWKVKFAETGYKIALQAEMDDALKKVDETMPSGSIKIGMRPDFTEEPPTSLPTLSLPVSMFNTADASLNHTHSDCIS